MRRRLPVLLLACALLGPAPGYALTSDREQPIHIEADRVEIDDVRHVSVYRGNVRYSQGTMRLEADTVSIHYDAERNFQRLTAEGQPARFRQRLDGQAEDMRGEALKIEYTAAPERLVLKQQAQVWSQGDEFAGDLITYDIAGDRVVARRGEAEEGRVQVVIQPRQTPAAGAETPPADADGR
ncbi:MAG: lipopolysaccharide transport periplasmic protein LptA [Gammaproteobacteria bacterium]